jgi:ATP-dependent Clp protease ATP-binding subunit ClpB
VIQRRLQDPLAQMLLEGKIGEGAKVKVGIGRTGLTLNGEEFASSSDDDVFEHAPSKALN